MEMPLIRNRRAAARLLGCLLLAVILAAGPACAGSAEEAQATLNASGTRNTKIAVDPIRRTEGFSAILYDNRNGMPTSEANAIAQTSDGFIWIGSYAGLIRYDGNTFERIEIRDGILNTRCLYVDSKDRLWIGTNDSGVFLMSHGIVRKIDHANQPVSSSIRSITEGADGTIYVASARGILTIDPEMNLSVVKNDRVAKETILDLRPGADGLIYGVSMGGDLFTLKDGKVVTFLRQEDCRIQGITAILPDNKKPGNLYVGTMESRIYNGNLENNFASLQVRDIGTLSAVERFEYIGTDMWLCAQNGIGKVDAEGFHRLRNVPMDKLIGHVMTDHEGNLWFTSTRQCVMKIVPNRFLDLFERNGLEKEIVNTTCVSGRELFIGTENGLIVTVNGEKINSLPLTRAETASGASLGATDLLEYLEGTRIRSIIRDSRGRLWISTWTQTGLLCYDQGELTAYTKKDGLISQQVRTIHEFEDGTIVAAQPDGVSVIRNGRVTACYGIEDGIEVTSILTVEEGFNHEMILGSDGDGIYIFSRDGSMKHIGVEEGLQSEIIMRLKRSRYRDVMWIATGNSLAYMTPDYKITTIQDFPYPNNYDLYENSKGEVWVLCSNGIYVADADEMIANEELDPAFYGSAGGLPYIATSNSFSELTDEGDLFIAGINGAIKVNIEKDFRNTSDFKIGLPYIDADGARFYPDPSGKFMLPGNARKVTLYPHVFSYSLSDPEVTYRLDGFDQADTTIDRSRIIPVNYTNLMIGAYQFVMTVEDPVDHRVHTETFQIVKGKELSAGTVGTIIMILASLLMMGGIMAFTSPQRKRNRLEDRLLTGLLVTNFVLAGGELLSYVLEYITGPVVRGVMIAGNTLYYLALVTFLYLLLIYLDTRTRQDTTPMRKRKLLYGIPCFAFLIVMMLNVRTGWVFSIRNGNVFRPGKYDEIVYLFALPYIVLLLIRMLKQYRRLAVLFLILIAAWVAGRIIFPGISPTAFIFTMSLVCMHLCMTNQPLDKEAL